MSKGMLGRVIKNFSSRNDNSEDVEEDEDDEDDMEDDEEEIGVEEVKDIARVYFTLEETLKRMDGHKLLKEIAARIAQVSPAFQSHDDNEEEMYGEVVNFLHEFFFMSASSGTPGYALEKVLNQASSTARKVCKLPTQERNADVIAEITGAECFRHGLTWTTEISAAYVLLGELRRRGLDDDTIKAVEAMIRPMHEHEF